MIEQLFENAEEIKVYFKTNLINTIAIYGAGTAGKFLYSLLRRDVKILYFIDNYINENKINDIDIVKSNQVFNTDKVDAVVITVLNTKEIPKIRELLLGIYEDIKIYDIREINVLIKKEKNKKEILEKIKNKQEVKIVVGAGNTKQIDWISTDIDTLNILKEEDFKYYFDKYNLVDAVLCEHVFEHLDISNMNKALLNIYRYLKNGGRIRAAVPDGYNPNELYIDYVKPFGFGSGSDDHKMLYNYLTFTKAFENNNLSVNLLEYYDEYGKFHYKEWNVEDGFISRSMKYDTRNYDGTLRYTSLIVDAIK